VDGMNSEKGGLTKLAL